MKRLAACLFLALIVCASLPAAAQPRDNAASQARASRKAERKQAKAQRKYAKAQRKAQRKMLKKDRKNTHYPQHHF